MTDYYPLLQRAVAGREADERQNIFARARAALERQLRGFDPPLAEAAIAAELEALDAVIVRIEAELQAPTDTVQEPDPPALVVEPPQPATSRPLEVPVIRPRAPMRNESGKPKKSLAIFGSFAIAAMVAMGILALSRKDGDRSAKADPPRVAAPSSPAGDEGKTEGRLGARDGAPVPETQPAPPQPAQNGPASKPASGDSRPSQSPASAPRPTTSAGSRAFVVLEVAGNAPNQFEGKVEWSFAPDPTLRGQKVLRAKIDFVGSGLKVDLSISRNTEAALNASHIVMAVFDPGAGIENIREMSGIEWRGRESEPGSIFAGMVVPVQDNVFMIGLDRAEASLQRNMDLLRNQKWLVFEVRLANGRRGAILAEKGVAGEKAIADALAEWK